MLQYRIHGDNIVECERTLDLIARALANSHSLNPVPSGSPLAPTYSMTPLGAEDKLQLTFFPGYGRWNVDINAVVRRRGGILREAADAIVCKFVDDHEQFILALEYCGALPAGNQAWQRNGRALSFAHAGIPYLYIAELSGYELNDRRERRAARLPNPAVPFSYLLATESIGSASIPVFIRSPGASDEAVRSHTPFYGEVELLQFIRQALFGESTTLPRRALEARALALVKFLADTRQRSDTLPPLLWERAFDHVSKGDSLSNYLVATSPMPWSKTAYIGGLTATARLLISQTAQFAIGLTSSSLPMCIIPAANRQHFAMMIAALYPTVSESFIQWCAHRRHLAICWIMGFKPRGDDARPDRGLPPLCRMLIGDDTEMLTVVYGPAPKSTWPQLATNPSQLISRNGLWEAILACSDALLIDTSTLLQSAPLVYRKEHWATAVQPAPAAPFVVNPAPLRPGENDVDTLLHLLFARLGHPHVFEGMCNPPGGDWSGLSMLTADRSLEYRWLGLPRVTAAGAKRPDHVFQVFAGCESFLIVAIESKERPRLIEPGIGARLQKYVGELVLAMPSVQRAPASPWGHYAHLVDRPPPEIATGAAFVATNDDDLSTVGARAQVDVVFGFFFPPEHDSCNLHVECYTPRGEAVGQFLATIPLHDLRLSLTIQS